MEAADAEGATGEAAEGEAVKLIYADPPYPGQAKRHYAHDPRCAEVDHAALIRELEDSCDGWALSSGADLAAMRLVIPLLPDGVRVCSWVKPFASFKPGVTLAYAWEPVYVKPARKRSRILPTVRDWVSANITLRRGLSGAKPDPFWFWLFDAIGAEVGDSFGDLYPGTGGGGRAWQAWNDNPLRRLVG
ncbi:hypothetical protein LBMAG42_57490 [Deltaproteobacteria bacterium]|nr:hypothetical protein LBMAG42_57490 [Deltaproteobacteria bacterium]